MRFVCGMRLVGLFVGMIGRRGGGVYLFGVVETDLAGGHAAVFFEVGPRSVDYCYVVFLVAWEMLGLSTCLAVANAYKCYKWCRSLRTFD